MDPRTQPCCRYHLTGRHPLLQECTPRVPLWQGIPGGGACRAWGQRLSWPWIHTWPPDRYPRAKTATTTSTHTSRFRSLRRRFLICEFYRVRRLGASRPATEGTFTAGSIESGPCLAPLDLPAVGVLSRRLTWPTHLGATRSPQIRVPSIQNRVKCTLLTTRTGVRRLGFSG
jgi:hypothetical protein